MAQDAYLLTPGPLTTSLTTKQAMLNDWGSWDSHFHEVTSEVSQYLLEVINDKGDYACVPMQGSGTYSVEAAVGTLVKRDEKVLVPSNGAYCERAAKICKYLKLNLDVLPFAENQPMNPEVIRQHLIDNPDIKWVVVIHCETSSGIMNPLKAISQVVAEEGRKLIIDAMSTFGALPIDCHEIHFDAIVASPNKCLEGTPGFGFVLARKSTLSQCEGNAHSLSLDLYDQWQYMEKTRQWRYTPPTHVVAACLQAIKEHQAEGGCEGRLQRYQDNFETLVSGMRALGFTTLLGDAIMSPIIVTFNAPPDQNYNFTTFYNKLREAGFIIYPGKLTVADTFRVGCIGQISSVQMKNLLIVMQAILDDMGVQKLSLKESSITV